MRIVVVGAGIAGAVTALVLSREGHDILVLESAGGASTGASHANAGLISPGHCFSWAEPGVVGMAVKAALGAGDGIGICQPLSPSLLKWGYLFSRQSTRERWFANSRAALALSAYSRDELFAQVNIPLATYGGQHDGILYLYGADTAPGSHDAELLNEASEPFRSLNADEVLACEPVLKQSRLQFPKAVFSPTDGTGDAAQFAAAALQEAIALGAKVHFSESVENFEVSGKRIKAVVTEKQRYEVDGVVVSAGLASSTLLRPIGYHLPIHAVSGYSVTYAGKFERLPRVGAVSIPHKIAWTSFNGDRVRFTGFADIGIPNPKRVSKRFADLKRFASDIMPEVANYRPLEWVGQRPMTPDNLPFLGSSNHENLWLNCGHGAMGWTMSFGSARVISDLVGGKTPRVNTMPYRWDRFC
ncbi:FAD-dependent oxidoreductase [Paraburkholderia phymatum]|uniref:FAD-dependent oxidoreductase n=1 Tax=Paraburkholderia phymatum TaxID=148447 RepID=UPI00317FDF1A